MEHRIVPRKITYCPPAFAAPSPQARPLTEAERDALTRHAAERDAKQRAARDAARKRSEGLA